MEKNLTPQKEIINFFQIILRKKWIIFAFSFIALVVCFYLNKLIQPVYSAKTELVYEVKESVISDLAINPLHVGNNTYLKNLMQEVSSWSLMNEVVTALPDSVKTAYLELQESSSLPVRLNQEIRERAPEVFSQYLPPTKKQSTTLQEEDLLTYLLQKNVKANAIPKSDILVIYAEAFEPGTAALIANTTANLLKKRNHQAKLGDVHNIKEIIAKQLDHFEQKVFDAEIALRSYKENHNVANLDQESQEIFKRITDAEVEQNRIAASLDASKERLNFLRRKLTEERKDLVPSATFITSPWISKLKENLIELEYMYTNLKVLDYAENHPKLVTIKAQINETKKNLKDEMLKIARGETTIDPLSQIEKSLEEIAVLEIEIHTYEAKKEALSDVLEKYSVMLASMPQKEFELGQLIRNKDVSDKIYTMLLEKYEEAKLSESEEGANIRIIDPARTPFHPIRPKKMLNLILSLFFGFNLGVLVSFLSEIFNIRIRKEEDVDKYLGLPVISVIPRIKNNMSLLARKQTREFNRVKEYRIDSKLITALRPNSHASEAFISLRSNLGLEKGKFSVAKSLAITSSDPQEGKSLIAANLAISTARMGLRTLLIDCDLRKPTQHTLFELPLSPGLTNVFESSRSQNGRKSPRINRVTSRIPEDNYIPFVHSTDIHNLFIVTAGSIPSNPSELLESGVIKKGVHLLKNSFDLIIFDLPPVNAVIDPVIISKISDAALFVIRTGKCRVDRLLKAKTIITKTISEKKIGIILNNVDVRKNNGETYAYRNYYRSKKKKSLQR